MAYTASPIYLKICPFLSQPRISWAAWTAGKSMAVNLKSGQIMEVFRRHIRASEAVAENFKSIQEKR